MTTEAQQAAPETGPMTLDQFTAALDAEQAAASAPAEEEDDAPAPGAEPVEAEAEAPEAEVEEPDAEEEPEAEAAPIPDPPQSWSKEDREAWAELTPKAREVVLKREADRDKAIAGFAQKTSEAVKVIQTLAQQTQDIAHLATTEFERKWGKGEEGEVDWPELARLARQYPDQYDFNSTRAAFEAERADLRRANEAAAKQSELAHRTFLAEEGQKLTTLEPELVDAKDGQARRQKTFEHLKERGFPQELFANISALELSVAYDAMRWRESQKAAKAATLVPRKNPAAPAAKAVKPAGSGEAASPQRTLQGLSQRLTNSGKLDDFVALMDAEEAARARKAPRR